MAYESSGTLKTDKREVAVSETWETQTDWEAFQSNTNIEITNGSLQLATAIPDSVVSRWKFNEGSGTTANDSVDGNSGTINGATYTTTAVEGSHALSFDGADDNVNYGQPSNLAYNGTGMSISAWVNTTSSTGGIIYNDRGAAGPPWFLFKMNADGTIDFTVHDGSNAPVVTGTTAVNDGTWHHVVGVIDDGTELSIYIDNSQDASTTPPALSSFAHGADVVVGMQSNNVGHFDGIIDDVSPADTALTASEINSLYQENA